MMWENRRLVVPCGFAALALSGCWVDMAPSQAAESEPVLRSGPGDGPPELRVTLPDWPPLGPASTFELDATDDVGLDRAEFSFLNDFTIPLSGTQQIVDVASTSLGEGFGTMVVAVWDRNGSFREQTVTDLLVDLSPPLLEVPGTLFAAANVEPILELWVADTWVLGTVEIEVDGNTMTHSFEEGYPATLGTEWDASLVKFSLANAPAGDTAAVLIATDAAGNSLRQDLILSIDAEAPTIEVIAPRQGGPMVEVSGSFEVVIEARDDRSSATQIELRFGETPVASALGPRATLVLDAGEFPLGALELEAVAMDAAGNQSDRAEVTVLVVE